jgi:pimeloyl-ACP methyl ester carboxylesterase
MSVEKFHQSRLYVSMHISRRELLKLAVYAAAGAGVSALLPGCSPAAPQATVTPTPLPTATLAPTATNTPVPTAAPTATTEPSPAGAQSASKTKTPTPLYENSRKIVLQNKRELRIHEMGKPDGIPIIYHHGTPESGILYDLWAEHAAAKGIRLIGYDRPGYGDSTANPGRSVASAAEDVTAIVKELGLSKLMMVGISGGGPHVLACAALLPDLVVAAAVLGSPAPYTAAGLDWFSGMNKDNIEEFDAALQSVDILRIYTKDTVEYLKSVDAATFYFQSKMTLSAADAAQFTESLSNYLYLTMRDGVKNGSEGWVEDDLAFLKPWGFDPEQIQVPVLIIHNDEDVLVPISHGKWLASHLKNVETRFGQGSHIPLIPRISEANAWLLGKWK